MSDNKLQIASTYQNLRLCIIENTIYIEELISQILGTILNIDWKESKSFGFKNTALSFNQKVYIILDIKGIEKEDLKKFITLMNIRNKFAHISHIKLFDDLFTKTKVGKQIKSNFHNWYFDQKKDSDIPKVNHEYIYRICFYLLVHDISNLLIKIFKDHMYNLGYSVGQKETQEFLINEMTESLKNLNGGKEKLLEIFSKL